jgi:hypothetical protein
MQLPELFYGTLAIAPVIVGIIALLKLIGLPNDYAPWANVALSLVFIALIYATGVWPEIEAPVTTALNILVAILTVAGVYDVQKNITDGIRGTAT